MDIQEYDTYVEYEKIDKMLDSILLYHEKMKLSYPVIKPVIPVLRSNQELIKKLKKKFHSNKNVYCFSNKRYHNSLKYHLSILIGYHTILNLFNTMSYINRVKQFSNFQASVRELKSRIEWSHREIEFIPPVVKMRKARLRTKFSIGSMVFDARNDHNPKNTFSVNFTVSGSKVGQIHTLNIPEHFSDPEDIPCKSIYDLATKKFVDYKKESKNFSLKSRSLSKEINTIIETPIRSTGQSQRCTIINSNNSELKNNNPDINIISINYKKPNSTDEILEKNIKLADNLNCENSKTTFQVSDSDKTVQVAKKEYCPPQNVRTNGRLSLGLDKDKNLPYYKSNQRTNVYSAIARLLEAISESKDSNTLCPIPLGKANNEEQRNVQDALYNVIEIVCGDGWASDANNELAKVPNDF